eukprot:m.128893 g.128893  ORF g.128893 m.128893 type:complete len:614 (+) comp14745_c0_seq1:158-1999(+)
MDEQQTSGDVRKPPAMRGKWSGLNRTMRLAKVVFPSVFSTSSQLTCALLVAGLAEQLAIFQMGIVPSQFYGVLTAKPVTGFEALIAWALTVMSFVVLAKTASMYICARLAMLWRRLLSQHVYKKYFHDFAAYHINHTAEFAVESPDQRMVNDITTLSSRASSTLVEVALLPLIIAYYAHALAQILSISGPVSVFAYFLGGLVVNKLLMEPVIALTLRKDRAEGTLRFAHAQHRALVESAAFLSGSHADRRAMEEKLSDVEKVQGKLVIRQLALDTWVNVFNYFSAILSYILVAVPLLAGAHDAMSTADLSSLISRSSFVAMYLLHSLSTLIAKAKDVSEITSLAHRIGELLEALDAMTQQRLPDNAAHECETQEQCSFVNHPPHGIRVDPGLIAFDNACISVPGKADLLLRNLTLTVSPGSNLLVTGPSGCGKTSLVRTLLGLWPCCEGNVTRPAVIGKQILFLPQKPFFTSGSLFDCINYPLSSSRPDMERARIVLGLVELSPLIDRAGGLTIPLDWEWFSVLSQGEQQRLAFARVLFHQPTFAVLDEATSAISDAVEEKLFQAAENAGITLVTVGHRLSLVKHHHRMLQLDGQGGWALTTITTTSPKSESA